jgi:hypothetical protein
VQLERAVERSAGCRRAYIDLRAQCGGAEARAEAQRLAACGKLDGGPRPCAGDASGGAEVAAQARVDRGEVACIERERQRVRGPPEAPREFQPVASRGNIDVGIVDALAFHRHYSCTGKRQPTQAAAVGDGFSAAAKLASCHGRRWSRVEARKVAECGRVQRCFALALNA